MTIEEKLAHEIPFLVARRFGVNTKNYEIAKDLVSFAYFTAIKGDKERNLRSYVYKSVFKKFLKIKKKELDKKMYPLSVVDSLIVYTLNETTLDLHTQRCKNILTQ